MEMLSHPTPSVRVNIRTHLVASLIFVLMETVRGFAVMTSATLQ